MSIIQIKKLMMIELEKECRMLAYLERRRKEVPEGSLQVKYINNDEYYYQVISDKGSYVYINLDPEVALQKKCMEDLAEKKIIVHGVPILRKNIDAMEKCVGKLRTFDHLEIGLY